ncbi:Fimbrial adhesin papG precursor [Citrobacter freundii]|nr:Fimbrial adhesin papG precursor [Citrobacter freundii]
MICKTKLILVVFFFSGSGNFAEADVVFNQMSGTLEMKEIEGRRGQLTDISVLIKASDLSLGAKVYHQNNGNYGYNAWSIGVVAYPQPTEVNGVKFDIEGGTPSTGHVCIDATVLGVNSADSWPCGNWASMNHYANKYIPMKLRIPYNAPVGRSLVNIPVKVCLGRSLYDNTMADAWSIIAQWAGECKRQANALVTMPTYVTVLNKCNATASQITLDHHVVTKGIDSQGNIASSNLNVDCDGPTSINISYSGTSNLNAYRNAISLGDGWISQLSTEIDGENVIGNVSFVANTSKLIKLNSALYGEIDATPGEKISSGAASLIMSYN